MGARQVACSRQIVETPPEIPCRQGLKIRERLAGELHGGVAGGDTRTAGTDVAVDLRLAPNALSKHAARFRTAR